MKTIQFVARIGMLAVLSFWVFTACENPEETSVKSVEGTYMGTLIREDGLKKLPQNTPGTDATAVVQQTEQGVVEVHFQSPVLDTTMMLNYYDHHDSVKVCLTGDDYENMYGHMLEEEHMSGGMMGHMNDGMPYHLNFQGKKR